jgi:HSP20 family protein
MKLNSLIPWKKEDERLDQRRDNRDPFAALQRRMNSLFDDFLGDSFSTLWSSSDGAFVPQMEVSETGKEVHITAELPGLEEKDIEVNVTGKMLTLSGEKKEEKEGEKGSYWHSERKYGYFERSVSLPDGVDSDKATAKFKKGVLKITFPKKPEEQNSPRKIQLLDQ